ncbi:hypothetical protein BKA57DRAFT_516092 [Linnemannia elongata]|nr:hypothetical protein BKA57DRAFT_516092 [Linnemannia elongata]
MTPPAIRQQKTWWIISGAQSTSYSPPQIHPPKKVTGHLVKVHFGHNFEDYLFSPTPPSTDFDVYVDHIWSRMVRLLSQVNIDAVHILMLLANADYSSGRFSHGYRMEFMAARMVQELGLRWLYIPDNSFAAESERIAFEATLRTCALCTINDVVYSLISGMPGVFAHPWNRSKIIPLGSYTVP